MAVKNENRSGEQTPRDRGTIYLATEPPLSLAQVEHWVEDGLHHFRGLDYDMISVHENEQEAVNQFVESTEDLLDSIAEEGDEATPDERELLLALSERFRRAYSMLAEQERRGRWLEILVGRSRRVNRGNWRPASASTPERSAPASTA